MSHVGVFIEYVRYWHVCLGTMHQGYVALGKRKSLKTVDYALRWSPSLLCASPAHIPECLLDTVEILAPPGKYIVQSYEYEALTSIPMYLGRLASHERGHMILPVYQ